MLRSEAFYGGAVTESPALVGILQWGSAEIHTMWRAAGRFRKGECGFQPRTWSHREAGYIGSAIVRGGNTEGARACDG